MAAQGARLMAWEMVKAEIPVSLIPHGAEAYLMQQGLIRWVVVGADRITANGGVVNKIGTDLLAVNAWYHDMKFMMVVHSSTVDADSKRGEDASIEYRDSSELLYFSGQSVAALGVDASSPVFDVTPFYLIDAIGTEKGFVKEPTRQTAWHTLYSAG